MTARHVLDAALLIAALVFFLLALPGVFEPRLAKANWAAAGLSLWCLTVFLTAVGVR